MVVAWEDRKTYPSYSKTCRVDGVILVRRLKQSGLVARMVYGPKGFVVQTHPKVVKRGKK